MRHVITLCFIVGIFFSCSSDQSNVSKNESSAERGVHIVTTTGMLKDLVENLSPKEFKVSALMGPGVDPHYYKASQGDLVQLQEASLIIYNGLHLEGKMGEVLKHLAKRKHVWEAGSVLTKEEIRQTGEFVSGIDPHFWFDVNIWKHVCKGMSLRLQEEFPRYTEDIVTNEKEYLERLNILDLTIKEELSKLPKENRVLFTAHDAFGYFGRAYDVEVMALQGLSTTTEFGLKDVQNTVETIIDKEIKAIFVESSVSPKAIQAVVEQCGKQNYKVVIGGELFSDAMGDFGTPEGTYIGMLEHNLYTFVNAIK